MYLIFLDTETTGLNPEKHRIVEIAYTVVHFPTKKIILSYESIIAQPLEVWAAADPISLAIHGLEWEQILLGKTEKTVASEIINDFNHLELNKKNGFFICQNPSFDRVFFLQLISADLQQQFGWPYHWLDLASMYWTMRLLKDPDPSITFKDAGLSKNEIALYYGLQPEQEPHRAMNGVKHLISCYESIFGHFSIREFSSVSHSISTT